ncbi:Carboxypeptidase regulatory-like domain-containing protein [Amycolatopsis sacchari]|uniref:Carboxypeptidase regulatory-like domain-containing protein n=1 Tax=Amycolatopsis sacchari TaxID=115433 RepID=A0A1I3TK09_9PSEU|nr:carboxypeptidase regulatory-like domain-containing protein [Amycolatopsis sacchari]SFJ69961.1 Carboxypeptidase regulatory-like domain-containing protein [Amycolatopsis sacchari]
MEISGRISGEDGAPVPGAALTLVDTAGRQTGRTTAGQDGRFRLPAPGPGTYVLITSAPTHQPEAATVTVATSPVHLEITLRGSGGLRGVVRAAVTGVPILGAAVTLTDSRGEVVDSRLSGQSGEYAFTALPPGSYVLAVNAPGYRPAAFAVTTAEGGTAQQDVELDDGAVIQGSVRLPEGPRPAVTVTLLDEGGHVVRTTFADEAGRYAFHDLDPGTYTVVATSYSPVRSTVRIGDGGRTRHDVQLV